MFGACLHERNNLAGDAHDSEMVDYIGALLIDDDYPALAGMVADVGLEHLWSRIHTHARGAGRFARTLARLDALSPAITADVDAVVEALEISGKMFDPSRKANFTEGNVKEIQDAFAQAQNWATRAPASPTPAAPSSSTATARPGRRCRARWHSSRPNTARCWC